MIKFIKKLKISPKQEYLQLNLLQLNLNVKTQSLYQFLIVFSKYKLSFYKIL